MEHIFISYSRSNEKQVTRFAEGLRKLGFEVWQDISGKRSGIPYSVKWFEVIEEAIFTAAGAIIFKNEAWSLSKPCQQEFQMIQETALPFVYMTEDRLLSDELSAVNEAARWCRAQIASKENNYRRWMLSGAYRIYKGLPIEAYFLTGRHFIRNRRWLKVCDRIADQTDFQGPWTESLDIFLRKAWHKLWWDTVVRILAGIFLFVAVCWVLVALDVFPMFNLFNETSYKASVFANEMRRVGEYDPIRAMQLAAEFETKAKAYGQDTKAYGDEEYILRNQGDLFSSYEFWKWFYYGQNRILSDFLSRNYPIAFYESATDCPADLSDEARVQTSSRYTVSLSSNTAQVFLYDRDLDITRQLLLATVPEVYCFNDAGDKLLLAAKNKVYIYDLLGEAPPSLLSYNFESVCELYFNADNIYAVTENGHIVVWKDPLLERKVHRENIEAGVLAQTEEGCVMAVYVDDGCLIRNTGNSEETYPLPFGDGVEPGNITVSSDCAYAAVSYRPDGSDTDWIGLVDLTDGAVRRTYDTGYDIQGYAFSPDDASLLVTCSGNQKIARINLETGAIQESTGDTYSSPYSIISYEDRILVCDTAGVITVYNNALEQVGNYRVVGYDVPQKQLAVSKKYDCLLTAGCGGNALNGFQRTWLSSDEKATFVPVAGEAMVSTTSVAVTDAGEYVAYGNAGGSVYIWDVGVMEQVWDGHFIPEAVVDMLFSDDCKTLYVLGSSGTIYEVDISAIVSECVPENPESIWRMHMHMAEEVAKNMYHLGLATEKAKS